jgi:hypothetical protein
MTASSEVIAPREKRKRRREGKEGKGRKAEVIDRQSVWVTVGWTD